LAGFALMTGSTFVLGMLSWFNDPQAFLYLGLLIRFLQGQGDIIVQITIYTVITSIYSDNIIRYITYIEMVTGVGLVLGPALASIVYGSLHYQGTMYFFGFLNLLAMIACWCVIPNSFNETSTES